MRARFSSPHGMESYLSHLGSHPYAIRQSIHGSLESHGGIKGAAWIRGLAESFLCTKPAAAKPVLDFVPAIGHSSQRGTVIGSDENASDCFGVRYDQVDDCIAVGAVVDFQVSVLFRRGSQKHRAVWEPTLSFGSFTCPGFQEGEPLCTRWPPGLRGDE